MNSVTGERASWAHTVPKPDPKRCRLSVFPMSEVVQARYGDMPRPVVDLGHGRSRLWLRPEIERWAAKREASGKTRPRRHHR